MCKPMSKKSGASSSYDKGPGHVAVSRSRILYEQMFPNSQAFSTHEPCAVGLLETLSRCFWFLQASR